MLCCSLVAKCGASPPEDNLISVLAVVVFNVFVPLHHICIMKMKYLNHIEGTLSNITRHKNIRLQVLV